MTNCGRDGIGSAVITAKLNKEVRIVMEYLL